jgi:hypothetical protein
MTKRSTRKSATRLNGAKKKKAKKKVRPVRPLSTKSNTPDWFGSMKGTIEILGDIISPANDEDEWEVLRD